MEAPQEQRFRPPVSADCPLFSERLEEHVIAVSPGRGAESRAILRELLHPRRP